MGRELLLADIVDSHDWQAVLGEALRVYRLHYSEAGAERVENCCRLVQALFEGRFPGYRRCLVEYHDFRHTTDVFLAAARLLDGCVLRARFLPEALARGLLVAALLHDTGYIQEDWDTEGTGAKYTREHEARSIAFMNRNASVFSLDSGELAAMGRMIQATDLKAEFGAIPFSDEDERQAGAILASADLMGQMADREYLEKLLFLYYEFQEAGIPDHRTEYEILCKTRGFYDSTRRRLEHTLLGVYRYAQDHFRERFGEDRNLYMIAIERQMAYLDRIMADASTNFRQKLRRGSRRQPQEDRRVS